MRRTQGLSQGGLSIYDQASINQGKPIYNILDYIHNIIDEFHRCCNCFHEINLITFLNLCIKLTDEHIF